MCGKIPSRDEVPAALSIHPQISWCAKVNFCEWDSSLLEKRILKSRRTKYNKFKLASKPCGWDDVHKTEKLVLLRSLNREGMRILGLKLYVVRPRQRKEEKHRGFLPSQALPFINPSVLSLLSTEPMKVPNERCRK